MIADIRVVRDCGQYTEGPSGLSITVWDHGEEINEIFIEKQAEDPPPFRGGDECRTLFSHPIAIYPLGYI